MIEVWTMGEMLCEIMRPNVGDELYVPGTFRGPFPSGAPAICIDTVARLGHSAGIISGVGDDDFGKCILDRLESHGVNTDLVLRSKTGSTGVAFVTYFEDGSRKFLYHFSNTPATEAKAPEDASIFQGAKFFHIMGCSLFASMDFGTQIVKTMHMLRKAGAKVSFDPNIRPELLKDERCSLLVKEVMDNCSVFEPGVAELLLISGKDTVEEAVASCFENPVLEIIALKNGSKGCTIYTRQGKQQFGVYPTEVLDATGAGDCFDGAFLCALLENKPVDEAAKIASAAASLNTGAFGPMEGNITPETIQEKMRTPLS